ncbi:MAG: type II secretion system protein GspM [Bryobacterales bacterium]|nr:type II secretion system protein GspM [Bryobacteraceae bacterium]MDW8354431.1 type II secretion system protein GspM [Bryobacterales bacterium]
MTLQARDRRALAALAVAAPVIFLIHWVWFPDSGAAVEPATESIPQAERRLEKLRRSSASLPAQEKVVADISRELAQRERGLIQADTPAQAQAQLLQIFRRVASRQTPPIELKTVEMGQVRPLGEDYGEITVPVTFDCRIEQLLNLLADLTAQPEIVATSEIRITATDARQKLLSVRLTVSGVAPRHLVPEKKTL